MVLPRHALGEGALMGMAHPELVHLIPLLPCIVGLAMLLYARRRRQAAEALGEAGLVRRLSAADLTAAPNRRILLVTLAALMLGAAIVGPLWGVDTEAGAEGNADVVLVLDASGSMRVRDLTPDRLEVEKRTARELLARLQGARVGLAIFAGRGYAMSPLTTDFSALQLYIDGLSPDLVTQGGSSLSDAIVQSLGLLAGARGDAPSGAMVVLTDGDALEERDDVLRAVNVARRAGVSVSTVGIGTPAGGQVPDVDPMTGKQVGWKHEPTGEVATSRLGAPLLQEIAKRTGGVYADASRPGAAAAVAAAARSVPARSRRTATGGAPGNRYAWFAGVALLLLAIDALLPEEPGRRRPRAEVAS
ncbi:vWA domain-containing protein [Longimicrobium sp.]|uniref:vWA domain-containing protein n=1 Tax=Longimicrobium sp. TaxID=2029185 RepID=UPI002C6182C0|nr:VWA domain-containing protein [Longimicrobium sp.]HSU12473.1 VWA domain-containing protein [Longimicrobium sp.]